MTEVIESMRQDLDWQDYIFRLRSESKEWRELRRYVRRYAKGELGMGSRDYVRVLPVCRVEECDDEKVFKDCFLITNQKDEVLMYMDFERIEKEEDFSNEMGYLASNIAKDSLVFDTNKNIFIER